MSKFELCEKDSVQAFEQGLLSLAPYDCVSEHRNNFRTVFLLGQSRAWADIMDRDVPIVIDWFAKIVIPFDLRDTVQAKAIHKLLRHHLTQSDGRWLSDIRSEARMEGYRDLARLVLQDIERGDLANRLVHRKGLAAQIQRPIARLRQQIGGDPNFDWRRVRLDLSGP